MLSRFWLAMVVVLLIPPALGAPGSAIETRTLESAILRENRIGLNPVRRIKVYLPPGYAQSKTRYPVIYMLHSINWDNERMFAPGTAAQPTFDRAIAAGVIRPFILVAPDYTTPGPGSMFANSSTAGRFEDHTLQEVIPFVDSNYRTLARPESRAITGDFMGAYGALRYAFRHPDVFSVVYGMHPVGTGSGVEPLFQRPDWTLLNAARSPADLRGDTYGPVFLVMIQTFLPNAQRPPLYCDFMVDVRDGKRSVNVENVRRVEQGFFLENIAAQERDNLRNCAASSSTGGDTIRPTRTCIRTASSRGSSTSSASSTKPRSIAGCRGTSTGWTTAASTPRSCRSSRAACSGEWGRAWTRSAGAKIAGPTRCRSGSPGCCPFGGSGRLRVTIRTHSRTDYRRA